MVTLVHPVMLIALLGAMGALVTVILACRVSSGVPRGLLLLLAAVLIAPAVFVFLAMNPELVDSRFWTYKAFYRDIREGMTRDEVFALLDRHYPKSGARQRPKVMQDDPIRLEFLMNPERSREPNCEGIFLTLAGGRVTKKVYVPD